MSKNIVTIALLFLVMLSSCSEEPANKQAPFEGTGDPTLDALTSAIIQAPDDPTLYIDRANIYYEKENFDAALEDIKQALSFDSTNAAYLHLLADVQLDYFRSFEALQTMEKVLKLYPQRIQSLLKMSEFQYLLKKYEPSIATANRVLQIDPQNADAYFMMGLNYRDMQSNPNAIQMLQKAVELNPDIIDAWITLGQLHAEANDPIALRYFDSASEIAPDNIEVLHAKAFYLMEQEQLESSIQLFKRIARIDPQYDVAHFNAGLLYLDLDSIQQAYDQFNITVKIKPTHAKAYYYRGVTLALMGKPEVARQNFEQALRFDPELEEAKQALDEVNL